MPISAYAGLPRSGKSYSVVENVVLPAAKSKRPIWTNIPLNDDLLKADFDYQVTYFKTKDIEDNEAFFDDLPPGIIFILDEAWRLWPAGLKPNNIPESHKAFLAEHGHRSANGHSTEIILATQDLSQIATFARNLVETTYRTVKLTAVGQSNKFRGDVYQGCVTGPSPPEKNRVQRLYGNYKKKVYKYYTSQTQSDGNHGSEAKSDDRGNILKGQWLPTTIFTILFLLAAVFYGYDRVTGSFGSDDSAEVSGQELVAASPAASNSPGVAKVSSPPIVEDSPFADFDLFQGAKFYISFNMGRYPNINYRITVKTDDQFTVLTMKDLHNLGYRVKPINECLVVLVYLGRQYLAMCQSEEPEQQGIFDLGDSDNSKPSAISDSSE